MLPIPHKRYHPELPMNIYLLCCRPTAQGLLKPEINQRLAPPTASYKRSWCSHIEKHPKRREQKAERYDFI